MTGSGMLGCVTEERSRKFQLSFVLCTKARYLNREDYIRSVEWKANFGYELSIALGPRKTTQNPYDSSRAVAWTFWMGTYF